MITLMADWFTPERKKMFYAEKRDAESVYKTTQGVRLRNPTEIFVVTDGFCASGCAVFTYNTIRTGSAIVAGYGGTYPGDENFVAGQCFATTISTGDWFEDYANNSKYGLTFATSFAEMYNISEKMDEITPNEFDTPRIDFHLKYYEGAQPQLYEILNRTTELYEKSKTFCNPANKHLIYVTDECKVDDPQALAVGYVCGDDGLWNKTDCRILTCQPMYSLDYVENKCVPNICDGRSGLMSSSELSSSSTPSASSFVAPAFGLIMAILFAMFFIYHY